MTGGWLLRDDEGEGSVEVLDAISRCTNSDFGCSGGESLTAGVVCNRAIVRALRGDFEDGRVVAHCGDGGSLFRRSKVEDDRVANLDRGNRLGPTFVGIHHLWCEDDWRKHVSNGGGRGLGGGCGGSCRGGRGVLFVRTAASDGEAGEGEHCNTSDDETILQWFLHVPEADVPRGNVVVGTSLSGAGMRAHYA